MYTTANANKKSCLICNFQKYQFKNLKSFRIENRKLVLTATTKLHIFYLLLQRNVIKNELCCFKNTVLPKLFPSLFYRYQLSHL
ncbi:hypothetical protein T4A_6612 [Trichinella pseudospiralis]|uniref:Uncharacterized protein n=1 Tax=Trichinella pseudospiralis TaxID=6337 RepID=A0A0V1ECN6_TRIPS|nr:hypothetical protein T4A_6612 [Trichinella pseudospiralis]